MKSRSSGSCKSSADAGVVRRLAYACALLVALVAALFPSAVRAESFVDRRVTAIPASALLTRDPTSFVDPRRQRAGRQLDVERRALLLLWAASQIIALYALWRSGGAARMRDALWRTVRRPVLVRFAFGAAVALIAGLAALPATALRYHTETIYELNHESIGPWLVHEAGEWLLVAWAFGVLTAFIYTLVARTRIWYAYAIVGLFAFAFGVAYVQPVAILPLFDRVHPLDAVPVRATLRVLEERTGEQNVPAVVDERITRSPLAVATIAGFGATKRIVLSDALLAQSTAGEIAFVVARELVHARNADPFKLALVQTFAFIVAIALAATLADRIGFRRDDDALARLPFVVALSGVAVLLFLPLYNGYARGLELRADRVAVTVTGDPASAVRYFVRLADESLIPVCVPAAERVYFLNFPPLGARAAAVLGRPDPCS
jgi:STE24 endopeptidase